MTSEQSSFRKFYEDFKWYIVGTPEARSKIIANLNWGVLDYLALASGLAFAIGAIGGLYERITTCEIFSFFNCGGSGIFGVLMWIGVIFALLIYPATKYVLYTRKKRKSEH